MDWHAKHGGKITQENEFILICFDFEVSTPVDLEIHVVSIRLLLKVTVSL